jgi:hypothetical protein
MTDVPHLTDWQQYGLADIWNMVKGDDFTQNFNHVKAWDKMQVLCQHQADSLRKAAAAIAERWPPEHSAAAGAFASRLETLAVTFANAAAAATTNGWTLHDTSVGLLDTHIKLGNVRDTWGRHESQENERIRLARQVLGPLGHVNNETVLMMSNIDPVKSLVNMQGAPQVPSGWRQSLDKQARDLMTATDRDLLEARTRVTQIPTALGEIGDYPWPPPATGGGGGAAGVSGSGFPGAGGLTSAGYNPPAGEPGRSPFDEGEPLPDIDPVLDGGAPSSGSLPGGQLPSGPFPGGTLPGGLPAGGSGPWVATPVGRALAPGAVIGESGPAGGARAASGMMPMSGAGARPGGGAKAGAAKGGYVAPPGGMIGGRPQGGKGGGGTSMGAAPGNKRRRRDDGDGWAVASGVPGVLVPDPEPDEHDPGPGVIGIDR